MCVCLCVCMCMLRILYTSIHIRTYIHVRTYTYLCVMCCWSVVQSAQPDPLEIQRQQEARRRALARKKAREQMRVRTPDAVDGRRHTEVQTELYLEEITDRVTESDMTTQTDAFLDRPTTPLFIPAKSGKDVSTQIEEGDVSLSPQ